MKIKEIAEMTKDELSVKEREFRQELFNLRMQSKNGQLEKPSKIRQLKRDIARVQTVWNQKVRIVTGAPKAPAAVTANTAKA